MRGWFKSNVTVGNWIVIATLIAGFIGTEAVKGFQGEAMVSKVENIEPRVSLNTKHSERTDVHHSGQELIDAFVTKPIFEAYKTSQKALDDQFQKQLFINEYSYCKN